MSNGSESELTIVLGCDIPCIRAAVACCDHHEFVVVLNLAAWVEDIVEEIGEVCAVGTSDVGADLSPIVIHPVADATGLIEQGTSLRCIGFVDGRFR